MENGITDVDDDWIHMSRTTPDDVISNPSPSPTSSTTTLGAPREPHPEEDFECHGDECQHTPPPSQNDAGLRGCIGLPRLTKSEQEEMRALVPSADPEGHARRRVVRSILLRRAWPTGSKVSVGFLRLTTPEALEMAKAVEAMVTKAFHNLPFSFEFQAPKVTPATVDTEDVEVATVDEAEENATTAAQVRVSFIPSEGNWSLIGREVLCAKKPGLATLNIGDPITTPGLVLHLFAHAAGLIHTRPQGISGEDGVEFDEDVVKSTLNGPNLYWSHEEAELSFMTIYRISRVVLGPDDVKDSKGGVSLMSSILPPTFFLGPDQVTQVRVNQAFTDFYAKREQGLRDSERALLEMISNEANPDFLLPCDDDTELSPPLSPTSPLIFSSELTEEQKLSHAQHGSDPYFARQSTFVVDAGGPKETPSTPKRQRPSIAATTNSPPPPPPRHNPWPLGATIALGGVCVAFAVVRAFRVRSN